MTSGNTRGWNLRQRVRDRSQPPLIILPIALPEPAIVEIAGFAGAEAVLIDAEHGAIGPETMRSMLAHARSAGTLAVFRPPSFDATLCRQALDAGAAGIHVSHVDTPEQARAVVEACRYAPLGQREMSLGRAVDYDSQRIPEHVRQANECELLVVMIETPQAVERAEAIAAVPGIDVLHIGRADLSHAMGLGVPSSVGEHARLHEAVDHVLSAAAANDVVVGFPCFDPERASHWADKGVRYFEGQTPDYLLRSVYADRLARMRQALDT